MDEERYDDVELDRIEEPRPKSHIWLIVALVGGGCLLLVVVVFMLIASLVLPGLSAARTTARTLSCKNNLKQIGIALVQYIDERGSHRYYPYPAGRPGVPDDYSGKEFLAMIWWTDLVSESGIFLCPSSTDDNRNGADLGVRDGQYLATDIGGIGQRGGAPAGVPKPRWTEHDPMNNHYISYASKGWKVSFLPNSRADASRSVLTDQFPSDTVIACDDTLDPPNHPNGFCVLFADSHVDFLSGTRFSVSEEGDADGKPTLGKGGQPPLDMVCN